MTTYFVKNQIMSVGVIWMLMVKSMTKLMMRLVMMISTCIKSGYAGASLSSKQCHSIWTRFRI